MNIEEEDMLAAIRKAKGRLVNFHVSDNNRMAPGMGTLNWPRIMETLREIGYDSVLSVEFCAPLDHTPANLYPNLSMKTRKDYPLSRKNSWKTMAVQR